MTRLPRDLSGDELARRLGQLGYHVTRQTGSHLRLTTEVKGGHRVTIPRHSQIRVGTLAAIVADLATHHQMSKEEMIEFLFRG